MLAVACSCPAPPYSTHMCATVSSHPPGEHTPSDGPLAPQLVCKGHTTPHNMQTRGHMSDKMSRKLTVRMHVRTLRTDIHALGAQSCVTTVPECSYVMDR